MPVDHDVVIRLARKRGISYEDAYRQVTNHNINDVVKLSADSGSDSKPDAVKEQKEVAKDQGEIAGAKDDKKQSEGTLDGHKGFVVTGHFDDYTDSGKTLGLHLDADSARSHVKEAKSRPGRGYDWYEIHEFNGKNHVKRHDVEVQVGSANDPERA